MERGIRRNGELFLLKGPSTPSGQIRCYHSIALRSASTHFKLVRWRYSASWMVPIVQPVKQRRSLLVGFLRVFFIAVHHANEVVDVYIDNFQRLGVLAAY